MTDSTDNARGLERICDWCDETSLHRKALCPVKGCDIRADPAPDPLGAVKVKPLVWNQDDELPSLADAVGCGVLYRVVKRVTGKGSLRINNMNREHSEHESVEAAKAAAQDDYEARIRSALEPCDPLVAAADALVEALRQIKMAKFEDGTWQCVAKRQAQIARAALAAFDKGGKDE